jgi:hypothetical protein
MGSRHTRVSERDRELAPDASDGTSESDRPRRSRLHDTVAVRCPMVHPSIMPPANDHRSPIPSAPFDDLDLYRPEDEEEWERRVMALATARIAAERARLERLGIVDARGDLVSRELPSDMLPESETTLETG